MKRLFLSSLLAVALPAMAATPTFNLTIKDHRFQPSELTLPAQQKVKLVVSNEDASPEEFEGEDFDVERIIPGNTSATLHVGPFKPGRYEFMGEFNEDTAQGVLIVE
ncbi:cupredoxin domain-containing protein [Marinobacteraceae bacterium S3BR75-40.1]